MNFTCPYCSQPTTITNPNKYISWDSISIDAGRLEHDSMVGTTLLAIACPNSECKKLFLSLRLSKSKYGGQYSGQVEDELITSWQLLPESSAKPQPAYIPEQIISDYTEACRIKDLSPKASATLARRCLQGMIRDFHGIKKRILADEINELKGKIPVAEWNAIDALRSIGNIGAHMEEDVNLIIDIDPSEADRLIAFIEYLFRQWYVKRHEDEENLLAIQKIAGLKLASKKPAEK